MKFKKNRLKPIKNGPMLMLVCLLMLAFFNTGCTDESVSENDQPTILVCGFAQYDWVINVLGDNPARIEVQRLNESGTDMHSYQPTVADMVKIADCDLLIYTGGESEFWIDDAVDSSKKPDSSCLSLMEVFDGPAFLCEKYPAAYSEHDHDHEREHEGHLEPGEEDHDHEGEADEHLWLSLKMAPAFIESITDAICSLDPANSSYYEKNSESYINEINELDSKYEQVTGDARKAGRNFILIADRFPFIYLTEDYHLSHMAAFPGCSAETEASFATILSLSEAIDNCKPGAVFVLKKSEDGLAQTVIKNSSLKGLPVLMLDDMQSVTSEDIEAGCSYISIMEDNLAALEAALDVDKN